MRILIADPSRTTQRVLAIILSEAGHEAVGVLCGSDALGALAVDDSIDVLITSFELPDMTGLDLCREARRSQADRSPLYIFAMSASVSDARIAEALDSGADDFIGKPPSRVEFFARLRAAQRVILAQNELVRLATVDLLTDLPNRRAFFLRAASLIRHADDERSELALVLFDIDHFKTINDRFGHDAGDAVLRGMGEIVGRSGLRGARIGGEEFGVLIADVGFDDAVQRAEMLRSAVQAASFSTVSNELSVTISLGIARYRHGESLGSLMKRADVALYAAKSAGRNRLLAASEQTPPPADSVAVTGAGAAPA